MIGGQHAIQSVGARRRGAPSRRAAAGAGSWRNRWRIMRQAIGIVLRHVMRHAADRGVHARAAERFGIDHLARRALHQVRPAESHEAGALHHDDDVAERGQVRAAGDARPHHRGDLRNAQLAPHQRVVIEDARPRRTGRERCRPDKADSRRPNPPGRRSAARLRMAISCARRILVMVSGHHAPAFTVASFATITAGRPSILPSPVTTPAAGA